MQSLSTSDEQDKKDFKLVIEKKLLKNLKLRFLVPYGLSSRVLYPNFNPIFLYFNSLIKSISYNSGLKLGSFTRF
jgi:hypothetical protein